MLALDDPRWQTYAGGRRAPYDTSAPLRRLLDEGASGPLWDELWNELYHQGDVGPASFAAVPWLLEYARRSAELDWNVFGLIAVIELERVRYCQGAAIPEELVEWYHAAIARLPEVVGTHVEKEWSPILMQHVAACIALARGQRLMARAYLEMDRDGAIKWLGEGMGFADGVVQDWASE